MQSYIQFTDEDFSHYDPATAYAVGCIVNTRSFQNAVFVLRKKHGHRRVDHKALSKFLKPLRHKSPLVQDDIPANAPPDYMEAMLYEYKKNEILHDDVEKTLRELGKARDNLWRALLLSYAKLGLLPWLHTKMESHRSFATMNTELETWGLKTNVLEEMRQRYELADKLQAEGKIEDFKKVLQWVELEFVHSDNVSAYSRRGDVIVQISPSALEAEIREAVRSTKEYRAFFRKAGKFGIRNAPKPNHLKEMVMLSEQGKEADYIADQMKKKYRISISSTAVRQYISRAKKMGF